MENQMKICFVSLAQFSKIWSKALPCERFAPSICTLSMFYTKYNTLFIVGSGEDFASKVEDIIPTEWLV